MSANEMSGEVVGRRGLAVVCQRRLGLSKTEDRRLEYYSVLEDRQDEFVRGAVNNRVRFQSFLAWRGWIEIHGGWDRTADLMETDAWRVW